MGDEVGIDPVDDSRIDISHLKQGWSSGAAVFNDHGHACADMQEHGIRFGCCDAARMINRYTSLAGADVLAVARHFANGEGARNLKPSLFATSFAAW